MTHILFTAINAVLPIILTILLGYCLRRKGFFTEDFLKLGNRLVFMICLPCMLFVNVYDIESLGAIRWDVVFYCVAMTLLLFILGLGSAIAATKVPERRGVILQCTFRSNFAIIGLPLAATLGGEEAQAAAAIIAAFAVPVFNILAVISLSVFTGRGAERGSMKGILRNILQNPLILAISLGLLCLVLRMMQVRLFGEVVFALRKQGKFLYTTIGYLKAIASPLALLVLGGQFEFTAVKGMFREVLVGTVWRTVLAPLLGIGVAAALSVSGIIVFGAAEYPALIALFGSPVAVSSAIMAEQMHNDSQLATQLVVWTSLCAIVTIFLQVCVLMAAGLL